MTREMADNAIDVALAVLILMAEIISIMKKCGDSIVMKDALSLNLPSNIIAAPRPFVDV